MIDLLYPVNFKKYDPEASSGKKNPGGGMVTKLLAVRSVLSKRYLVNVVDNFDDVKASVVIIEPLTLRMMEVDVENWLQALRACKAKKILYCSEMEVSRWSPKTFKAIVEAVDVITANTDYQDRLIRTLSGGRVKPMRLCDPIDESLFKPIYPKARRIFGAGRISEFKNTEFQLKLFKAIKAEFKNAIETAYFGSADLWGENHNPIDYQLQEQMKATVDVYHGGMKRHIYAQKVGESLIFASKTTHDVYSSLHVELLACEVISLGGGHLMFRERPGISGLKTVDDFLVAIEKVLNLSDTEFTQMQKLGRKYMLKHCSFDAFLRQFEGVIQKIL